MLLMYPFTFLLHFFSYNFSCFLPPFDRRLDGYEVCLFASLPGRVCLREGNGGREVGAFSLVYVDNE